jgi:peptide/nickel transport system substrate-binding protein
VVQRHPLSAADVAFTFNLMKKYADVNTWGLPISSASWSGSQVTINFTSPQYANLENIAGESYIVPQSIWASVGDPGKYLDANPVEAGRTCSARSRRRDSR